MFSFNLTKMEDKLFDELLEMLSKCFAILSFILPYYGVVTYFRHDMELGTYMKVMGAPPSLSMIILAIGVLVFLISDIRGKCSNNHGGFVDNVIYKFKRWKNRRFRR